MTKIYHNQIAAALKLFLLLSKEFLFYSLVQSLLQCRPALICSRESFSIYTYTCKACIHVYTLSILPLARTHANGMYDCAFAFRFCNSKFFTITHRTSENFLFFSVCSVQIRINDQKRHLYCTTTKNRRNKSINKNLCVLKIIF